MAVDILGREEELASLLAFLDRARDGAGALVLEGQAGIGKTTLWLTGVEAARERSLRVLSTRPAEAERELGYAGLGDLLAGVLEDALPALSTPRRRALEAALLLEDPVGGRADARAVAVAVQDALRALAEPAPVVVAVDDVQWLDVSSAAALAFALRRLEASSVRVLLAHRAGTVRTPVEDALPGTERVEVGPLSVGAVQGLLKAHLDRAFPRPVLRRLHEVSGGNPFYALELGRALVREGVPAEPSAPLRVPETLERLVGDRLRALPEETGAALLVVAAVGAPGLGLLDALGVDPHALEAAVAAEVVEHADGEVRFTHPLLASAVYARASAAERRRVHARIAAVVAEPVAHASHLARSLDAPDAAAAARLEEAAALARDRGAPALAAELAEASARATSADDAAARRRRLEQAVRDHWAAGSGEQAFARAQALLADAPAGPERGSALALLGELHGAANQIVEAVQRLREAAEEPSLPAWLEVVIHLELAHDLRIAEGLRPAAEHARLAVATAEGLGDDALTARALAALATVRFNQGEPDGFTLAERGLALARDSGDAGAFAEAATAVGHCLLWSGRIAEAREVFEELVRLVADRDEPGVSSALWYLSLVEQRAGNLALARRHSEESRELAVQYGGPDAVDEPSSLVPLVRVALHAGEHERARALAERGAAFPGSGIAMSTVRANVALLGIVDHWTGDPSRAVERFEAVDRERRAAGFAHATSLHLVDHVEALLALGRPQEAVALLDEWEEQSDRVGHVWAPPEILRSRGLVAAAEGDVDRAVGLLEAAAAAHERVGDPFGRGRALLALGTTRRRARQKRPAREAIEEARATFERIGAAFWAEKARAELGRIGGRTKADGLTPAEQRVAALVAEGKTNREVAAALFLGERTVETHLSHVYAKLGIRSRAELARTLR